MNKLEALCNGIVVAEGWERGSRSWRNNNPGNLKGSPFEHGKDVDFSTFKFFYEGWLGLYTDVWRKCTGRTHSGLTPESTLSDLVRVFTGLDAGEAFENYMKIVMENTGETGETKLKEFVSDL